MQRTISGMIGDGSAAHNLRYIVTDNVNPNLTSENVILKSEKVKDVYHELFDEALEQYNAKQNRSDRIIKDYHKHIRHSRQEKEFYEVVFQYGNRGDTGVGTLEAQTAKKILTKFAEGFEKRNPHLRVFLSVIHMDEPEGTPHVHIDFVPFATESKRGLSVRNSLSKALEQQGFKGEGKFNTCSKLWIDSEKMVLSEIMLSHGIEWLELGTTKEHLSVYNYKREKRREEVEELDKFVSEKQNTLSNLNEAVAFSEGHSEYLDMQIEEKYSEIEKLDKSVAEIENHNAVLENSINDNNAAIHQQALILQKDKAELDKIAKKKVDIESVENIEAKKTLIGNKITINVDDYNNLQTTAQKYIALDKSKKKLKAEISDLKTEVQNLAAANARLKKEVQGEIHLKLELGKVKNELSALKNTIAKVYDFIEQLNLRERLELFLNPPKLQRKKTHSR
ncbi:MAG: plasmid recombination protein [Oscillospiraceae bacterium]|nr:plasmid recombination protein [Oscillospiraceae bacterium]